MKKCPECMLDDAPYNYCCTVECEHMFCEWCQAKSKRVANTCPYKEQEEEENNNDDAGIRTVRKYVRM